MNVKALQQADRWLGVPLCCGLTLVRKLFRTATAELPPQPKRILFVKLAEQGSTVLAYPALRRAVEMVGRENVYFLAFEDNRFILDLLEVIPPENVCTVSVGGVFSFVRSVLAALTRIRALQIDTAVDMEFFARGSAAITFLTGAQRRIGFHAFFGDGPYRGDLLTHRLLYNPHLHTSRTFLSLVEAVTVAPESLPTYGYVAPEKLEDAPLFAPARDELDRVRALLPRVTAPLILLNPNASDLLPLRRWPNERYVQLATRVLENFPTANVAFTGAPNESAAINAMVQQVASPRCFSLAGKTTLRELLVLYTLADVLVTNDSGPAHFATLTPIQVVTLFGPETPTLFAALTPRNTVLWAGIACSPCVSAFNNRQSACKNNLCMQAISVEQVVLAVGRALRSVA
jgi:ADP-heptose:LPS heptosyltransferase